MSKKQTKVVKTEKTVKIRAIEDMLKKIRLPKHIILHCTTSCKMPQKFNPFGKVIKHYRIKVCINFQSDPGIRTELRENGIDPDEYLNRLPTWTEHVEGCLFKHKEPHRIPGKYAQAFIIEQYDDVTYENENGPVNADDVKRYLDKKKEENRFVFMMIKLANVDRIEIDDKVYIAKK